MSEASGRDSLRGATRTLGLVRLGIGLFQGLALWALYRSAHDRLFVEGRRAADAEPAYSWPATHPQLFGPLLLVFALVPVVALAAVGRLRPRIVAIWLAAAAVAVALVGWWDVARQAATDLSSPPYIQFPVVPFTIVGLFIAHHLILPADRARRWVAPYDDYFDTAWKAGVQLALSVAFTGAFWLLLVLGAGLFHVIGLDFLQQLIRQDWFFIPVTSVVFAIAAHLTDVRDGLIRGVRTVALMLLSWLLPVLTVLVAGFLVALPFTGVDGLWETGSATALVLSAAAALIILINAGYQDGREDNLPPPVLRLAARVASILLTPLVAIAFWGLALRIGQYGLTPDRIIALACALQGAIYALGYGWAALPARFQRGRTAWMHRLEPTNVIGGFIAVAIILALFSPLIDPARLSVADQVARLQRGAVTADKFDYRFLRFESGRAGQAALARLAASSNPAIRDRARRVQAIEHKYDDIDVGKPQVTPAFEIAPAGARLPAGFSGPVDMGDQRRGCSPADCVALVIDLNGDAAPEVLLATSYNTTLWAADAQGRWTQRGMYQPNYCAGDAADGRTDPRDVLRQGRVRSEPSPWPALALGDRPPLELTPDRTCTPPPVATASAPETGD